MRCVLRFAEERFPADCLRAEEAVLFAVDFFAAEELRADPLELFFFFEPVLFFDVVFFVFAPMKNQSLIILVLPTYFTLPFRLTTDGASACPGFTAAPLQTVIPSVKMLPSEEEITDDCKYSYRDAVKGKIFHFSLFYEIADRPDREISADCSSSHSCQVIAHHGGTDTFRRNVAQFQDSCSQDRRDREDK